MWRTGEPGDEDYRVAIYPSLLKVLPVTVFGGVPLLGTGVGVVLAFVDGQGWGWLVAGILVLTLAALVIGKLVRLPLTGRPGVVLDRSGLRENVSFGASRRIAWSDIRSVDLYHQARGGPQVEVEFDDRAVARRGPVGQAGARLGGALRSKGTTLYIPQMLLPPGFQADDLRREIVRALASRG